jgi:uncharacterized protein
VFDRNPNPSNPLGPRTPGSATGWGAPNTLSTDARAVAAPQQGVLTMSFIWMFVALLVSAGSAWLVMSNTAALEKVAGAWFVLVIAELGLVVAISALINRIGALPALALLFVYALLNGLMLGLLVDAYTAGTGISGVVSAFAGASAVFAGAAVYGRVTGRDLTRIGGLLTMGLLGLIVASFVQIFLFPANSAFNLVIGAVGVIIFTGLTAFHVQALQNGRLAGVRSAESASVLGALLLYLDFVNLFLLMLRLFSGGGSRS